MKTKYIFYQKNCFLDICCLDVFSPPGEDIKLEQDWSILHIIVCNIVYNTLHNLLRIYQSLDYYRMLRKMELM